MFIVDESGSMGTPNFRLVRSFLHSVVSGLDVGLQKVRVGIVVFHDTPSAQTYLDTFDNKTDILQFINILPYRGGGTKTGAALDFTRTQVFIKQRGRRKDVQQVAVVITDGQSQDDVSRAAADLRRAGVTIYTVGVAGANKTQLLQMASEPPHTHVFNVDSFDKLKGLTQSLQKTMCTNIKREQITDKTSKEDVKEGLDQFFLIVGLGNVTIDILRERRTSKVEGAIRKNINSKHSEIYQNYHQNVVMLYF